MPRRAVLFLILTIFVGHPAHAARPFVTDDARVVDEGGCQIETFVKRQRRLDEREFWFLPACSPAGKVELTAGRSWTDGSAPGDSRFNLLQAKTLLKALQTNGSGYALTVGALRVSPFQTAHTTNPYVNGIGSFSFADDRVVMHANLGAINDRQAGMTRATWGLGAEIAFHPQLIGIVESYGQRADKPTLHYGLRVWIVPNRVQVDGTLGAQHSGPPERAFRSLGLRILF
ncbi:MAG: hypothetical protein EXR29_04790 [Betaproteobacteria bacterium]|nr:hypothetical protein [Betaproteobacteria bacterium]